MFDGLYKSLLVVVQVVQFHPSFPPNKPLSTQIETLWLIMCVYTAYFDLRIR